MARSMVRRLDSSSWATKVKASPVRRAAGAADAVNVIIRDVRAVEVDHVGDGLDVDAAGGDVGGDEDAVGAILEAGECGVALALGAVAVDGGAVDVVSAEEIGEAISPVLGAGEADDGLEFIVFEEFEEEAGLEVHGDGVDGLGDADGGGGLAFDLDDGGVFEELHGELADFIGHRGGEEEGLAFFGEGPEDAADVGEEAHVEHAVGFVEDEDFEVLEVGVGEAEVIEEAAGGGDDDVDAGAEGVFLRAHAHAAVDRSAGDGRVGCHFEEVGVDLRGEFAGGRDNECADGALFGGVGHEAVDGGEEECGGFAGAGLGAGENVAAFHGGGMESA